MTRARALIRVGGRAAWRAVIVVATAALWPGPSFRLWCARRAERNAERRLARLGHRPRDGPA